MKDWNSIEVEYSGNSKTDEAVHRFFPKQKLMGRKKKPKQGGVSQ